MTIKNRDKNYRDFNSARTDNSYMSNKSSDNQRRRLKYNRNDSIKNIVESIIDNKLSNAQVDLISESSELDDFSIYRITGRLVNNVAYNKTSILNQIRAIPNVTVVTTISSISSANMISVTEKTDISIKLLFGDESAQVRLKEIETEIQMIDGVRGFKFDLQTFTKVS